MASSPIEMSTVTKVQLIQDEKLPFLRRNMTARKSTGGRSFTASYWTSSTTIARKEFMAKSFKLTIPGGSGASGLSSSLVDDLSLYIQGEQQPKRRDDDNDDEDDQEEERSSALMKVSMNYGMKVTLEFDRDFVASLCRILPRPFLQFVGRVVNQSNTRGGDVQVGEQFDKRFELQDILPWTENSKNSIKQSFKPPKGVVYSPFGVLTFSVLVGWEDPHPAKRVVSIGTASLIQNLFENESTKDFTIVAGNGGEVKCHKIIFAAQSSVLTKMVSTGMMESESGRVELKENSEDGIRLLLRYLYGLELVTDDLSCDLMVELFQTAHKYNLDQLQGFMYEELLLRKDVEWFTPDVILELHFYARNVDEFRTLTDHSLFIMTSMNPDNLRNCEGFKKLGADIQLDLLCELMKLMQKKIEAIKQPEPTSESESSSSDTDSDDSYDE